jgi:hypothetical protein
MCTNGLVCKLGDCTACAAHQDCSTTQICNYIQDARGRCITGTGRQWDVYIAKVTFPMFDSTGQLWDPGGLPDPRIEVVVDNVVIGSATFSDTYSVDRTGQSYTPIRITLPSEMTTIDIFAYDEDIASNDYADSGRWTQGINLARQYGYAGLLANSRVRVEFAIFPVP